MQARRQTARPAVPLQFGSTPAQTTQKACRENDSA